MLEISEYRNWPEVSPWAHPVRAADAGALKKAKPMAQLDEATRVVPSPALSLEPRRCNGEAMEAK